MVYERWCELHRAHAAALVLVRVPTLELCVTYDEDARTLAGELGLAVCQRSEPGGANPDILAVPINEADGTVAELAARGYPVLEYAHVPGSERLARVRSTEANPQLRYGYDERARRHPEDVTLVRQGEWLRAWDASARVATLELGRAAATSLAAPAHPRAGRSRQ